MCVFKENVVPIKLLFLTSLHVVLFFLNDIHVCCLIINVNNLHAYTNIKIILFSVIINILIYNY